MLFRAISVASILTAMVGCSGPDREGGKLTVEDLEALGPGQPLQTQVERKTWEHPHGMGKLLISRHYRIYTSTRNGSLLATLPGFLEGAYANYLELTDLGEMKGDRRMDVYMLSSREEWANLTEWILGPKTVAMGISAGGYSYRGVGVYWDLRRRATLSIAAHEGLHQFLFHRMKHRLPLCIEEGLAVTAEGFHLRKKSVLFIPSHNPSRYGALRSAIINGRWIPIQRLMIMNAEDYMNQGSEYSVGWYGQVWALSQFLRTDPKYREGLKRMFREGQAGRFHLVMNVPLHALLQLQRRQPIYNKTVSRPVFEHYITPDLAAFEREYLAFARKLAGLETAATKSRN